MIGLAANFFISCSQKLVQKVASRVKPRYGYVKLTVDAVFDIERLREQLA